MKKIVSIATLVSFFAATLVSCDDDLSPNSETEVTAATGTPQEQSADVPRVLLSQDEMILLEELSNKTPKISMEHAMDIASNFLGKSSDAPTLSKRGAEVPRCEVLTRSKQIISKSGTTTEDIDTLMYLFNYDEGYAVVSADIRVPERVLAYSEEGSVSANTDNPGLQLFFDMAQVYVEYNITKAESMRDSLNELLNDKFQDALGVTLEPTHSLSKAKREISRTEVYSNCKETHVKTYLVGPYITTFWHQNYPYNEFVPTKGGENCHAGCVAVAFAQLMAYWQWPLRRTDAHDFIWSSIVGPSANDRAVADLIKEVGFAIKTEYDTSCSYAYTEDGIKLLQKYGYTTCNPVPYDFFKLKRSLDNERPVIIDGRRQEINNGIVETKGHCWLVDGYARATFQYDKNYYYRVVFKDEETGVISEDIIIQPEHGTFIRYYQHFNLGWENQGSTRGYYMANVFDVTREYRLKTYDKNNLVMSRTYEYGNPNYKYNVRIVPDIYYDYDYDYRIKK